jgi:hypothetical protein
MQTTILTGRFVPWTLIPILCLGVWIVSSIILALQAKRAEVSDEGNFRSHLVFFILLKDHTIGVRILFFSCMAGSFSTIYLTSSSNSLGWDALGYMAIVGLTTMLFMIFRIVKVVQCYRNAPRLEDNGASIWYDKPSPVVERVYVARYTTLFIMLLFSICRTYPLMQAAIFIMGVFATFGFWFSAICFATICIRACYVLHFQKA